MQSRADWRRGIGEPDSSELKGFCNFLWVDEELRGYSCSSKTLKGRASLLFLYVIFAQHLS